MLFAWKTSENVTLAEEVAFSLVWNDGPALAAADKIGNIPVK
jgi:hypothetical protein